MRRTISACAGLALGMMAVGAFAATKHPAAKGEKGPPACGALTFRAVASGASDGEQQAGFYRSRYGTLALHADVKGGQATDYFVLADGKRLGAAPATLPDWAASCAVAKKLPKAGRRRSLALHRSTVQGRSCSCRQRAPGVALRVRRLGLAFLQRRRLLTGCRGRSECHRPLLRLHRHCHREIVM